MQFPPLTWSVYCLSCGICQNWPSFRKGIDVVKQTALTPAEKTRKVPEKGPTYIYLVCVPGHINIAGCSNVSSLVTSVLCNTLEIELILYGLCFKSGSHWVVLYFVATFWRYLDRRHYTHNHFVMYLQFSGTKVDCHNKYWVTDMQRHVYIDTFCKL